MPAPNYFSVHALIVTVLIAVQYCTVSAHCPSLLGRGASQGAATCIYLGRKCTRREAGRVCHVLTSAYRQKWSCRAHACAFCKCHPAYWPCKNKLFRGACRFTTGAPRDRGYWGGPARRKPTRRKPARRKPARRKPARRKPRRAPKKPRKSTYKPRRKPAPKKPRKSTYKPRRKPASRKPRKPKRRTLYSPRKPRSRARSKPRRRPTRKRSCLWRGKKGVVTIPASSTKVYQPWVKRRDRCLVWRPSRYTSTIDRAGSGKLCYRFKVDKVSRYHFTLGTRAPHWTEHNDVWVKFPWNGFRLWKNSRTKWNYNKGWIKGYQNSGGNKYSTELYTVDFDGHQFETPILYPSRSYSICLSGRSSRYVICKIHFVACRRRGCASAMSLRWKPNSACY